MTIEEPPASKTYPPWDDNATTALNRYQREGWFHPFTCPGDHEEETLLVAETQGWRCSQSHCDYTQSWAFTFMVRENHSER